MRPIGCEYVYPDHQDLQADRRCVECRFHSLEAWLNEHPSTGTTWTKCTKPCKAAPHVGYIGGTCSRSGKNARKKVVLRNAARLCARIPHRKTVPLAHTAPRVNTNSNEPQIWCQSICCVLRVRPLFRFVIRFFPLRESLIYDF